jgi:threonine dehydratase
MTTSSALTFADGIAVRMPDATALEVIQRGTDRIVEISDDEIAEAIRIIYRTTHNCAEGAGAAALAGLIKERQQLRGGRAAVIVSGQNIDPAWLQTVLAGGTPRVDCERKLESNLGVMAAASVVATCTYRPRRADSYPEAATKLS